jgi:hypothetical protein
VSADADIFARARKSVDVGGVLGVAVSGGWRRLKLCPFCKGRDDFSYRADAYKCWKCGEHGDQIDLYAKLNTLSRFEAACKLVGADLGDERKAYAAAQGKAPAAKRAAARRPLTLPSPPRGGEGVENVIAEIKRKVRRADGTIVERYLESRGLPGAFARFVHFCPDAPYDVSATWGRGRRLPAMVCVVEVDWAPTGGLHCTYLREDGRGKADTLRPGENLKKMWGPQSAGGRPGGLVLVRPASEAAVLCVAEGVENALTLAAAIGDGAGAFAAGSLDRFQGGMGKTAWGRTDWRAPFPDPNAPAATIRHKGPVLLGVDSDMKALTIEEGTRFERVITPERRAQISGVLAAHWWRKAGASGVSVLAPPAGRDWNDLVREEAA